MESKITLGRKRRPTHLTILILAVLLEVQRFGTWRAQYQTALQIVDRFYENCQRTGGLFIRTRTKYDSWFFESTEWEVYVYKFVVKG